MSYEDMPDMDAVKRVAIKGANYRRGPTIRDYRRMAHKISHNFKGNRG